MVVQRKDSGEVDMYLNEQGTDVEEGGATFEDERDRTVGGMKEVGRYNDVDYGAEENDDDGGIEKADVEDEDVDADGKDV